MNSALHLLLLAALACLATAQDTQDTPDTSNVAANNATEQTKSDEDHKTDTGDAENEDKLDTAAVLLDGIPDNSTRVGDDAGNNATIAETKSAPAADETTSTLNTTEHAPTSVEDPQITVEKEGGKQISKLKIDDKTYEIVVEHVAPKNETDAETVTKKAPEDNSTSSTVTASEPTIENTSTVEVTTQENGSEDESTSKSTKAQEVPTTQEKNIEEESSSKSTNATTVEVTTQKNGSEEETSTKSTVSSSESTKAPTSEKADADELPQKNNRRKRDAGSEPTHGVVDPIITVERDGAKETHTLDLEGVRYQIVIQPNVVDPNVENTQDDGNDNTEDIVTGGKQKEASGNGTATTPKNITTPGKLSTEAPLAAKSGDNITKTTVAA